MKPSEALLDFGRPVAFYPGLVKHLGSVNAVLFFCQLLHYKGKEANPGLGIYKTMVEIEAETGLSRREQETARRQLRERGVLTETEKRLEHRIYFRLSLIFFDALFGAQNPLPADAQIRHPRMAETAIRRSTFAPSALAKTTAKTTTEKYPPNPPGGTDVDFARKTERWLEYEHYRDFMSEQYLIMSQFLEEVVAWDDPNLWPWLDEDEWPESQMRPWKNYEATTLDPRMRELMQNLELSKCEAVGILEILWHLAATEAPRGNIGKMDNESIAFGIDWEREPEELISGLIKAGWLVESAEHRLIVHNWSACCEDGVDAQLFREGATYSDGRQPRGRRCPV
jgi:hypothetical protein